MNSNNPTLWYFADPMCSWCWGFSPVISQIKENYSEKINIALVMGGLQTEDVGEMSKDSREEIFHHWHQVEEMTKQPISYENALPEGFVYNTEPACRAVITAGNIDPSIIFSYFTAVQSAFYTKNQDVTQIEHLQRLAVECGLNADEFKKIFESENVKESIEKSFQFTKKAGVQGFPTLILNLENDLHIITRGYLDYSGVSAELDKLLAIQTHSWAALKVIDWSVMRRKGKIPLNFLNILKLIKDTL